MSDTKPWETEAAPAAQLPEQTLLGSNVQPAEFVKDGKTVPLGEVVSHAFMQSGLTAESWNEQTDEEREAKIQAVVDAHFSSPVTPSLDELKARADELGVKYAANIGEETLAARIKEAEEAPALPASGEFLSSLDVAERQASQAAHIKNTKYVPPAENAPLALVNLVSQGMSMAAAKKKLGLK